MKVLNKIVFLFLCLLCWETKAQTTFQLTDSSLTVYLSKKYPLVVNSKGVLNIAEAAKVKNATLFCANSKVKNISGIQFFKNLTEIDFSGNQITDVSALFYNKYDSLRYISLANNKITTVFHLSKFPQLQAIYVSNNLIENVFGNDSLPNLVNFDFSNNKISTISDFKQSAKILYLDLNNNNLSKIPLILNYVNPRPNIQLSNNKISFKAINDFKTQVKDSTYLSRIFLNRQQNLPTITDTIQFLNIGDSLIIKFDYKSISYDNFYWTKNGNLLTNSTSYITKKFALSDTGLYICEVQNIHACAYGTMTILSKNYVIKYKKPVVIPCTLKTNNFSPFNLYQPTCSQKGKIEISNYSALNSYYLIKNNVKIKSIAKEFSDLDSGKYVFIVNSNDGKCADTSTTTIDLIKPKCDTVPPCTLKTTQFNPIVTSQPTCKDKGKIEFSNFSNSNAYYLIKNNLTIKSVDNKFSDLDSGIYSFVVKSINGKCADTSKTAINLIKPKCDTVPICTLKTTDFSPVNVYQPTCKQKGIVEISNVNSTVNYWLKYNNVTIQIQGNQFLDLDTGLYTLIVKSIDGKCADTSKTPIIIHKATGCESTPICNIKASDFSPFNLYQASNCTEKGKIEFYNYSDTISYTLYNIDTKLQSTNVIVTKNLITNIEPGTYQLIVSNITHTCSDTAKSTFVFNIPTCDTAKVTLPNEITPNGDGICDVVNIEQKGNTKIYNKAGVLVLEANSPFEWNGNDQNGQPLPSGLYVVFTNGTPNRTITILR